MLWRIKVNKKLKNTPNAMKNWLKAPKDPEYYIGDNYLTYIGIVALYNPIQNPWTKRIKIKQIWFGININIPAVIAIQLITKTQFL